MKTLLRIVLSFVAILAILILGAFAVGSTMPVNHSISVSGVVAAPPQAVFARITNFSAASSWRPEVHSVTTLPQDNSRDAWVEDLGHGVTMKFLAINTVPVGPDGHGLRQVKLDDAQYGGTWTYDISAGPTSGTTLLKITEDGYINPPLYRFMMAHVFGPTKNLQDYMNHIQAAAK